MKVREIMRCDVRVARPESNLASAGLIMLEAGCGVLPVVAEHGEVVGMITDRDICLAVALRDRPPSEVVVAQAMSDAVYGCRATDDVEEALRVMRDQRVRRLPVLDAHGRLEGILSLDDVVLFARSGSPLQSGRCDGPFYADVALTLRRICEPARPLVA